MQDNVMENILPHQWYMHTEVLVGSLKRRDNLEDVVVDVRVILNGCEWNKVVTYGLSLSDTG